MILPLSSTIILSIFLSVDRRWATAMTVFPFIRRARAFSISISDSLSRAEVASSKMSIGAFWRMARAMARRWRSPPESLTPFRRQRCHSRWGG